MLKLLSFWKNKIFKRICWWNHYLTWLLLGKNKENNASRFLSDGCNTTCLYLMYLQYYSTDLFAPLCLVFCSIFLGACVCVWFGFVWFKLLYIVLFQLGNANYQFKQTHSHKVKITEEIGWKQKKWGSAYRKEQPNFVWQLDFAVTCRGSTNLVSILQALYSSSLCSLKRETVSTATVES